MKISLLTDAPRHNLALMKLSAYHKLNGDEVSLNTPLWNADKRYASILFDWNIKKFIADEYGGPAFEGSTIHVSDKIKPDYDLFGLNYSLGYTFRYCPRNCGFCKVSKIESDKKHHSIFEFHIPSFRVISILNNNTFFDPRWKETFHEVWDAKLRWKDESGGFDLRLVDEEKATYLKKTRWDHGPKFAWDRMGDEKEVISGLKEMNKIGIKSCTIYVMIGYDTTLEEDIYRCQKIHDMGHDPFPMIYKETPILLAFRRMIYARYYRKSGNVEKSWKDYRNK